MSVNRKLLSHPLSKPSIEKKVEKAFLKVRTEREQREVRTSQKSAGKQK